MNGPRLSPLREAMRVAAGALLVLSGCQPTAESSQPASDADDRIAADRADLGWLEIRDDDYAADQWRWQFPSWAYAQIEGTDIEQRYDLWDESHLFKLDGDFDGDGQTDAAAWVVNRTDPSEIGVVVVHRAGGVHYVPAGGPNWEVYPQGVVEQGVLADPPPQLLGDALLFVKPEASSALWFWDGASYVRYQQGD